MERSHVGSSYPSESEEPGMSAQCLAVKNNGKIREMKDNCK